MSTTDCAAARFVPPYLVADLFFCWRLTAVGHSVEPGVVPSRIDPFSRYGRMLRAAALFVKRNPTATTETGAYKDLDALLGEPCGRINA